MQLKLFGVLMKLYFCLCMLLKATVEGCQWEENFQADYLGSIKSVSQSTIEQCCKFCLSSFNDAFAAQYQNGICTCLNAMHNKIVGYNTFYTYMPRVPFSLNQSEYECGSYGTNTLLTFNFVKSEDEMFVMQTINMDLNSNLSTAILMIAPDNTLLKYDGAYVGVSQDSRGYFESNFLFNKSYLFRIGSVNETTQFAISYTRTVPLDSKLTVYLKPFKVSRNERISYADIYYALYGDWSRDVVITLMNDQWDATADSEDLWYKLYFDDRLMTFFETDVLFEGLVSSMSYEIIVEQKLIKLYVPKLGCGTIIKFVVSFVSQFTNYQKFDSFYEEFSATIYQKDSSQLSKIQNNFVRTRDYLTTQQRGRNRRFAADKISLLPLNNTILICHWAEDRTQNLCGFLSLEGITTFTRLSAALVEPIGFDINTNYFYFEDILGNVMTYDYLKNVTNRVPDKKVLVLQLPSLILPVTRNRSEIPCCGYYAALDKDDKLLYYRHGFGVGYPSVRYAWPYPTKFVVHF